jgi:hypothetical protein
VARRRWTRMRWQGQNRNIVFGKGRRRLFEAVQRERQVASRVRRANLSEACRG